jgi:hypothetical protein
MSPFDPPDRTHVRIFFLEIRISTVFLTMTVFRFAADMTDMSPINYLPNFPHFPDWVVFLFIIL